MARHPSTMPTEVELQILRVLWKHGPCGVGRIHESLHHANGTTYSTTVKMLSVMLTKKLIKRNENQRPYCYQASWTRERTGKSLLGDLANKVYDGSVSALVLQALSSSKASEDEIERIREILEKMENRNDD